MTPNKTAMQQLVDWYNDPEGFYMPSEVEDKMKELLSVEKQQIIDACNYGDKNGYLDEDIDAEKYYNETFK